MVLSGICEVGAEQMGFGSLADEMGVRVYHNNVATQIDGDVSQNSALTERSRVGSVLDSAGAPLPQEHSVEGRILTQVKLDCFTQKRCALGANHDCGVCPGRHGHHRVRSAGTLSKTIPGYHDRRFGIAGEFNEQHFAHLTPGVCAQPLFRKPGDTAGHLTRGHEVDIYVR
jgi:hypothetical protein